MQLSVPLLLIPGDPDRYYTVHVHRVRWSIPHTRVPINAADRTKLEENARRCLRIARRSVSECVAAELADADADVEVTEDSLGTEAVARVLCDSEVCAAAAEGYRRDASEDAEAEAARTWAAARIQGQAVELLKLRGELERTMPGKTSNMLAVAVGNQMRAEGDAPARMGVLLDELAHLLGDSNLFADRSPEGVRKEIDRIIRQGRKPYPVESRGTEIAVHHVTAVDLDQAASLPTWTGPARGSASPTLTAEGRAQLDQLAEEWNQTPPGSPAETES
ncbi:hypothetical protein ACODT4_44380 [Streptomyces sp. 2.9]|uniref:hypothetical protein n=1 Tax=Streptomyces tritrimontium TaxID=3406573 RepID=UPI003BB48A47